MGRAFSPDGQEPRKPKQIDRTEVATAAETEPSDCL
jgi:hypothetical protein